MKIKKISSKRNLFMLPSSHTLLSFFLLLFLILLTFLISSVITAEGIEWEVTLNFSEPGGESTYVIFGEATDANDGPPADSYDVPLCPVQPFPPYIRAWFDDGLETFPGDPYNFLLKDYHSYPDSYKIWNLTVHWEADASTFITISWNPDMVDDSEYDSVVLYDVDAGTNVANMLIDTSHTFTCDPWPNAEFQIIAIAMGNNPPTANFSYYPTDPTVINKIEFNDLSTDTDGTIVNWSWDFGDGDTSYGDRALSFDGVDDYVETAGMYLDGSRSFEIWMKPNFSYDDGKDHEWMNWVAGGTYVHGFKQSDGKTLFVIRGLSNWRAASKVIQFEAGSWHHFVGVHNNTDDKLYLYWDGELVASSQGSGELSSLEGNFYIGKTRWSTRWFDGVIDDVRIYNRPLSSSEIQDNYNGSVSTSGLVSWWRMNDTGDIAADSVGGKDGAIHGAAWTNHASHRYTAADTYNVILTVRDDDGATDTISKLITVSSLNIAPTADFSFYPTDPTTSDKVSFNDLSTDTDGTIVNWSWDFGDGNTSYGDRALMFDGVDDYVETAGMHLDGSRSFELWMKPDFPYDDGKDHEWMNWVAGGTYVHGFKQSDGKTLFVIRGLSNWRAASKVIQFEAGSWHHFVGVHNNTDDKLYLYWDGELVASSQGSGELSSLEGNFYIGKTRWSTRWFDGVIDDVRIYNRPLSSSEIQDNYNGSVSTSGLVSWWRMNDTGDIAADSVGGKDGAIHGAAWTNHASHRYTAADTYNVILTVRDDDGATDTISKLITVSSLNIAPTADFSFYPTDPTTSDKVSFNDLSTDTDGTIVNWSWDFGDGNTSYGDRALMFDGVDDYVETAGMHLDGSRSFELWMKPDFPYDDGKDHEWMNWVAGGTYVHGFKQSDGKTLFVIRGLSNWRAASKVIQFEAGSWHHFAGIYNATDDKLYLYWDGELVASSQRSGGLSSLEGNFYIGKTRWATRWFDGVIDDVRIYNRPLSSSEIQDNYNGSVSTSGLVSWWRMNDTGDIAYDSVGGKDGAIHGANWTNHANHRYTAADTYNVILTVRDNNGTTDEETKLVTVSD